MKRKFEGSISDTLPLGWNQRFDESLFMNERLLKVLESSGSSKFRYVMHEDYTCCEYTMKLNLFTYGHLRLNIPFTVIGPPLSVCCPGFTGSYEALISDYLSRDGLFLILNMIKRPPQLEGVTTGLTLSTCIFDNCFDSFSDYMKSLRSSYRRRLREAQNRSSSLRWTGIKSEDFTEEMYQLYLNVLKASYFPLEVLPVQFFRFGGGDIDVLYRNEKPLAFVMTKRYGQELYFVFGGMDYAYRDEYDLYYSMLLHILKRGIDEGVSTIDFGQTAEHSKLRLGCRLADRYMSVFSRYGIVNAAFNKFAGLLEYKPPLKKYNCFRSE